MDLTQDFALTANFSPPFELDSFIYQPQEMPAIAWDPIEPPPHIEPMPLLEDLMAEAAVPQPVYEDPALEYLMMQPEPITIQICL